MATLPSNLNALTVPNLPGVPGNPTGTNNVPGGITGDNSSLLSTQPGNPIMNVNPPATNLTVPGAPTGLPGGSAFAQANAGTGTTSATGGTVGQTNNINIPSSGFDPTQISSALSQILNIPNTTQPGSATGIPSVTGPIPTTPTPTPINADFPANGLTPTGPAANIDLGSLLGVKQNTALPSQLDDIYGKGFGSTYASFLQGGGGFNPDINNALINAMRPQESRAFDNIRQTMANAGLSPSGSPFALAAGDFWSQAANNENATIASNFNQALDRTYNLFGQGLEAAQLSEANKMGPLQWLSALSPLLGPLISGITSKIPSINISSSTQSQGGTGTATGTGGTSTSTGTGGAGGRGGTSTSTSQGGAGGTATANPTVNPTITSTVSPTTTNTVNPTISTNPTIQVDPTLTNTSSNDAHIAPIISPSISPTMINSLGGMPNIPIGQASPIGPPPGPGQVPIGNVPTFPTSPGAPPVNTNVGSTINFGGTPIQPSPFPTDPSGNPLPINLPTGFPPDVQPLPPGFSSDPFGGNTGAGSDPGQNFSDISALLGGSDPSQPAPLQFGENPGFNWSSFFTGGGGGGLPSSNNFDDLAAMMGPF